jgi:DNA mismatch repair protein MutS2
MVPCDDDSELCVFDKILVDIGDEQSIEQSLSTFSSHMVNVISIIEKATPWSLVLIDELGSGTDPIEGAALATAILIKLYKKGARIAATTTVKKSLLPKKKRITNFRLLNVHQTGGKFHPSFCVS